MNNDLWNNPKVMCCCYRRRKAPEGNNFVRHWVKSISRWQKDGRWYLKFHYTQDPDLALEQNYRQWYNDIPRASGTTLGSNSIIRATMKNVKTTTIQVPYDDLTIYSGGV